jgi:hypothetical protein
MTSELGYGELILAVRRFVGKSWRSGSEADAGLDGSDLVGQMRFTLAAAAVY